MERLLGWLGRNWAMVATMSVVVIFTLFVLVTFLLEEGRSKRARTKLLEHNGSPRTYFIDLSSNKVRFFDATNIGYVRTITVTQFYAKFPHPGQRKVIDWVKELAYGAEGASDFIEVPITISKTGGQAHTMLQVEKVDVENGTLRLSSHILNFAPIASGKNEEARQLATLEEYASVISPNLKKKKGITACFLFAYKRGGDPNEAIDHLIISQLRSSLYPMLVGKRALFYPSENEIILFDTSISEATRAMPMIREAMNALTSYLSLNSLLSEIDFRCGAVYHADEASPESILERARETARYVFDTPEKLSFYQKGKSNFTSPMATYRTEIERIINDKKIAYYFRPIYSTAESKVVGYFSKQLPTDTYFETMDEVKNYALRSGDAESLFSTLFRRTLPLFIAQREDENQLLFFPIRVDDLPFMMRIVSKSVKARETKIVFLFNEADLREHINFANPESFIDEIMRIKAKGHAVGLFVNKPELGLSELVYQAFDYFACSFALASGSSMDNDDRVRLLLHALPERLLRYHKPIIATDIESWTAVGVIVNSGLELLSSELISKFDEMIEPLSPKVVKKIKDAAR